MLADHTPGAFVAVDDTERARAFYEDVLGLENQGFDGFALRMRCGPITLRIVKPPKRVVSDYTVIGWETPDIARDVAALTVRGVEFIHYPFFADQQDIHGVWTAPTGDQVAWFKDPDGNVLSLAQHA